MSPNRKKNFTHLFKKIIIHLDIIEEQSFNEKMTRHFMEWDPDLCNFELSMWSNTDGQNIRKTIARINKLKLSKTAENIFEHRFFYLILRKYSRLLNIKINWLITNKKPSLIEQFLQKNSEFPIKIKLYNILSIEIFQKQI